MNQEDRVPDLSVILITPDSYETIRKTVHCIRTQNMKDRIEIVIVAPSAQALQTDASELREFFQYRIVETGKIRSIGSAYAAGIRKASAPVVALGEEHSYPQRGWAEAILFAHRQSWAAVGPVIENANPNSAISWADFLIAYSPWMKVTSNGAIGFLPGHNCSYKRSILMSYGDRLENMMEAECETGQLPMVPIVAALILGLVADGIGQLVGYTFGAGNATSKLVDQEFHRDRHQKNSKGTPAATRIERG